MRREPHVRFCERAAVKLRRATHLVILSRGRAAKALAWTKAARFASRRVCDACGR